MRLADRLNSLGSETAFAVSAIAADWASRGNAVYPFHLGDIDLPTPSTVVEAMKKAIGDGKTGYCPGPGITELRAAIAEDVNSKRDTGYTVDNVTIQPGGKPVITKFLQAVMNPGDEVLYPNPGFPIYESQIEYFGGVARPYSMAVTSTGFGIDLDQLRALITPRTTALIYNDLHNPTSAESSTEEREAIAQLAIEHDLWVLSDEAYFETRYAGKSHSIASIDGMAERTVILYSFSKRFAMTGWRLGAGITPTELTPWFSRMNTNNESCTTHFVQYAGLAGLHGDQTEIEQIRRALQDRRDTAFEILADTPGVRLTKPESTFYLYPDVTEALQRVGAKDLADFTDRALRETGCSFCTRDHFGRRLPGEDRAYIRLAYSGINPERITEGLSRLRHWIASGPTPVKGSMHG